jgi:hypothetical protein
MASGPSSKTDLSILSLSPLTAGNFSPIRASIRTRYTPDTTSQSCLRWVFWEPAHESDCADSLSQRYEVLTDPYHNIPRLNLYKFDGSPLMPMYLAYSPPQMLPTQTLNPTTASGAAATATSKSSKFKRGLDDEAITLPMNHKFMQKRSQTPMWANADYWWWFGVFMTGAGSVLYFFF